MLHLGHDIMHTCTSDSNGSGTASDRNGHSLLQVAARTDCRSQRCNRECHAKRQHSGKGVIQNLKTCAPIWKKALSITGLNTAQANTGRV